MKVVISGASSGIGEALARHYAAPQNVLGLISRRTPGAELPGEVVTYPLDVTDTRGLAAAARDFIDRFGVPDLVIANAGVSVGTHGDEIAAVYSQIEEGVETHLYLTDYRSLYVGLLDDIDESNIFAEYPEEAEHAPAYYREHFADFWFRLTDIRRIVFTDDDASERFEPLRCSVRLQEQRVRRLGVAAALALRVSPRELLTVTRSE